ncbi:MAG: glycine dehydrogenase (aminomethyl-transferring), partial [Crocinitomicaceae bacterium]|nr:glycine dehydrogenase (aminomethyl-transferring) [Crocinitomicaceae bacterium]
MSDFKQRHIGPNESEKQKMIDTIGVSSIEELIDQTVPKKIRLANDLKINEALSENDFLTHMSELSKQNKVYKSFIGLGYHETITPSVILRNVLENPGWYTAYTPYQAEISQGRLEALMNFQTMVIDLTGMEIANASLLDEATAAAEAMLMFYNGRSRADVKAEKIKFLIDANALPQTIDVLKGRAKNLGIELVIEDIENSVIDDTFFGALIQYPDANGHIGDIESRIEKLKAHNLQVAVAADILSLSILKAPGHCGADVVLGSSQRFGVPMGYGGPHAAFFATKESFKRNMPGRIIGISKDSDSNTALRMALQTREQHIKRGKATSNICTAQALLAVMASMYAVYHGPTGIKNIANHVNGLACSLGSGLKKMNFELGSESFFDTVWVKGIDAKEIKKLSEKHELNFYIKNENEVTISFSEPHT